MQIIVTDKDPGLFYRVIALVTAAYATAPRPEVPGTSPISEAEGREAYLRPAEAFNTAPPVPPVPAVPGSADAAASPNAPAPAPAVPPLNGTTPPVPPPVPPGAAPSAPVAQTTLAPGAELDKDGLPWDGRIHADTKTKIGNGTWRIKRNVEDAIVDAIQAEWRNIMGLPPGGAAPAAVPPVAPPAAPPVPPPAATPPSPSAPSGAGASPANMPIPGAPGSTAAHQGGPIILPNDANEFMNTFTSLMEAGSVTSADGKQAAIMEGLTNGIAGLFVRQDLAPHVMQALCDMKGIPVANRISK